MKIVVQRVTNSNVVVNEKIVGKCNKGLMLLIGFTHDDTSNDIDYMVKKVLNLRIFDDEKGVMNKSILDVNGNILSISQFTLYADTTKGNRPSYVNAAKSEYATKLYDEFNEKLKEHINVETGIFGAEMFVSLVNDGPITIILESRGGKGVK
ncbi:MAG: D-tyrosyl-tRNA(Tyr) deacylase [Bacilli bacterium]|nr:D-tyrosyl-tRNA(Tyr) deacylase [Bacilli bacterium]